ncbi:hypothetical protein SK128_019220 [Halocaridina rubra]|uniref:Golgin subfamily A conserved domain-containing protein n=1 Tax=Halocaridina rubra TaxID=373956 RepID=A0AAN9A6W3_HALRR
MADSVREQKLAAARKKLRQFQKKKGSRRAADVGTKESTLDIEITPTDESSNVSESGTASSRASSLDLASEEFTEPLQDVKPQSQEDVNSHVATVENQTNGVAACSSSSLTKKYKPPDSSVITESYGVLNSSKNDENNSSLASYFSTVPGEGPAHSFTQGSSNTFQAPLEVMASHDSSHGSSALGMFGEQGVVAATTAASTNLQSHLVASEAYQKQSSQNTQDLQNAQFLETSHNTSSAHNSQNRLASYFAPTVVQTTECDPFAFIASNPESTATLAESTYNASPSIMQNESIPNLTVIEPDEADSQDFSELDNSHSGDTGPFQQDIPISQTFNEQPVEVPPEIISSAGLAESPERQLPPELFDREGSVSSETTASVTTAIHVTAGERQDQPLLKSSSESLRQISLQLSGLMSETEGTILDSSNTTIRELERRNSELAALLQQERETSQQQCQQLDYMRAQLERVEAELSAAQGALKSSAGNGVKDIESMREQLQVHIQTIGILVSEKSELQSSLTHANHALKQKAGEVTELDGRLSASRQRVGELEASMRDLTSQHDAVKMQLTHLSKDLDSSKMANFKVNKQCEELKASVAELTERLSAKTNDFEKLATQFTETKSQLAMAHLHVQQLRDSTNDEIRTQLDQVQTSYLESQREASSLQAALSQAQAENAQIAAHYQQYTTQLAEETKILSQQVEQLTSEKENLTETLEGMNRRLEEQSADFNSSTAILNEEEVTAERECLNQTIAALQEEKHQLKEQNNAMTNDNSQLSKLVDQLSRNIEDLEIQLERSKTEEVDTSRLLAAMQSDKVAAARALTQNKQLKEQLEELQSGFIIMSNKKLELTEKLERELHIKKGLNHEIATINEDLANMKQQSVEKDRELSDLRENAESLGNQLMLLRSQANVHADMNSIPEQDKTTNDETIRLREIVTQMEEKLKISHEEIRELSSRNTELNTIISGYRKETAKSMEQPLPNGNGIDNENESTDESFSSEALLKLQEAHEALEARFNRSMTQVAQLSDEKQNLEHVVQQLQMETDLIGDYITIYQFQRGVMKQQARERELELSSLRHEREEMKTKLATLQELVSCLGREKGPESPQLLEMKRVINLQPTPVANGIGDEEVKNGAEEENHIEIAEDALENAKKLPNDKANKDGKEGQTPEVHVEVKHPSPDNTSESSSVTANAKSPTVQKILDLLNEMESASQVEHCGLQKFHPCPLCSGKLMTV